MQLAANISALHLPNGADTDITVPLILGVLPLNCRTATATSLLALTGAFLRNLLSRAL